MAVELANLQSIEKSVADIFKSASSLYVVRQVTVSSSAVDTGSSRNTYLRKGLALVKSGSVWIDYPSASGAGLSIEDPVVLAHDLDLLANSTDGTAKDQFALAIVPVGGVVDQNKIIGADDAFISALRDNALRFE